MLTIAQAEVIHDLCNQGYGDGVPFTAMDAFPARNNKANGCRRSLRNLAKKGIVQVELQPDNYNPTELVDKFVIGQRAKDEFHTWATKRDYDFSCFSID
jgi:hypothetical protein